MNFREIWLKFIALFENPVFVRIFVVLVGLFVIWLIVRMLRLRWLVQIKDIDNRHRARKLAGFAGYLISIFLIAGVYSDQLSGLTVALGAAGVGIAFALQEVIASFAGWLTIMFGGFYRTGDRVQLGGITGDVIDIGMLRTTLMETGQWVNGQLYNGRIVRIANSFVFKEPVFNYSADFPFLWDEIYIPIRYGSDYKLTRQILEQIANDIVGHYAKDANDTWEPMLRKYMIEPASTEPMVSLTADENWAKFTIRYTVAYNKRRSVKDKLFEAIIVSLEATEGKVRIGINAIELRPPFDEDHAVFQVSYKQ